MEDGGIKMGGIKKGLRHIPLSLQHAQFISAGVCWDSVMPSTPSNPAASFVEAP
jgi:alpha-galactosidase/6-phospho-beta-glucosidase family protein